MAATAWYYYITKFIEFADTFFFLARKKFDHISSLHVIHHGLMPMSVWWGMKYAPGGHSSFFGFINSFVHIPMYLYYGLSAIGPQMNKYLFWKKYMTSLQMVGPPISLIDFFSLSFCCCRCFLSCLQMPDFRPFVTNMQTHSRSVATDTPVERLFHSSLSHCIPGLMVFLFFSPNPRSSSWLFSCTRSSSCSETVTIRKDSCTGSVRMPSFSGSCSGTSSKRRIWSRNRMLVRKRKTGSAQKMDHNLPARPLSRCSVS